MVSIIKDIKYDDRNNLFTDIYFPEQTSTTNKILIFWHGGGWIKGSKEACQELGVKFAKAGFTTMIPEYRLASQSTFPGAHQDSKTFVEWLLNSQYVTMPRSKQPIYQIGASVGATMALFIAGQFGFDTVC
ncbi:MAG: alpha/beta hydrolase, partial [Lactobacillus iners]|nr:alpha/beta hydrolase [Lactobacillus iners]